MSSLMAQVERRGKEAMRMLQARFDELGLPLQAYLCALTHRVMPRALWGAELLIVRPDWEWRLDNLQAGWLRRLLDTQNAIPRWAVLYELGLHRRLRATILGRVLQLLASVDLLAPDHLLARVNTLAVQWPGTWASTAAELSEDLGIPRIRAWLQPPTPQAGLSVEYSQTAAAKKRSVQRYMRKIVWPAIDDREGKVAATWWRAHPALLEIASVPVRAVEAGQMGWPMDTIRVWMQLRWRSKLTVRAGTPALAAACPVCAAPAANTTDHLFLECALTSAAFQGCRPPLRQGMELLCQLRRPTLAADSIQALRAAACIRTHWFQSEPARDTHALFADQSDEEISDAALV